eukprot:1322293-Amorphochlora_amoeboformis.AAC.1
MTVRNSSIFHATSTSEENPFIVLLPIRLANESKTKQRDPRRETKFTTTKPYNTSSSPFASLSPLTLANTLWSRRPSTMSVTGEGQVSIPIQ